MNMENKARIFVFTDGSCGAGVAGTGDIGAWASVLATTTERQLIYGVSNPTTISRMELIPIIESLVWLKKNWTKFLKDVAVNIYSDSEYVIKVASGLYEAHKNKDLWLSFGEASKDLSLTFTWYQRCSLPYMEAADAVASSLRTALKDASNKLFLNYKNAVDSIPFANLPT